MACTGHTNLTTCTTHVEGSSCTSHTAATDCTSHTNDTACGSHVNSCPSHSGYVAPVTPTTWTDPTLSTSINTKDDHHNELRTAIASELTRRSASWPTDPGIVSTTISINSLHVRQLRDGIVAAKAWVFPTYLNDTNTGTDDTVEAQQYTSLRSQVNTIEAECVCDCNYSCTCQCNYACTCQCNYACTCDCNYACTCQCNYACTCDCNYCTCDCNYCTCNCNYCTCNCNYSCTCNCNYSDRRLKKDIVYM